MIPKYIALSLVACLYGATLGATIKRSDDSSIDGFMSARGLIPEGTYQDHDFPHYFYLEDDQLSTKVIQIILDPFDTNGAGDSARPRNEITSGDWSDFPYKITSKEEDHDFVIRFKFRTEHEIDTGGSTLHVFQLFDDHNPNAVLSFTDDNDLVFWSPSRDLFDKVVIPYEWEQWLDIEIRFSYGRNCYFDINVKNLDGDLMNSAKNDIGEYHIQDFQKLKFGLYQIDEKAPPMTFMTRYTDMEFSTDDGNYYR
ncbi:hypothetical protein SARC_06262 [Sphaeroforma arctica JP610]|uniref:Glycoside hydrolase 131 catalytic N-terminal domain-containing protein n=1 Tax=Sphaeroforma arctica JP610 TaxID=667725 RepID=A0A0L0FXY2_9EUKA|nr:hypothetical protein SARC_06262 [Sphaeroforma arctica JP610]KNC81421.1 hypothetical protein SARC_06262 [Sphaeroforma arctica JP610]|eukprot:XP_014155323.1 hypothetical protein SARC_06262 [Sphaeroforma arctica JP610]